MDTILAQFRRVLSELIDEKGLSMKELSREFDVLVVPELEVLGNSQIEITHEVNFLTENGVKILSLKDGELNVETLPMIFRRGFRLVKKSIVRAY